MDDEQAAPGRLQKPRELERRAGAVLEADLAKAEHAGFSDGADDAADEGPVASVPEEAG